MITAEVTFTREALVSLKHPMQYVGIDWQTYEEICEEIGKSSSINITYNKGVLTIMPITELHELLIALMERLMGFVSYATRTEITPTGSATLRSKRRNYGVEPDLSFFVSNADVHQTKDYVSKEIELAPDIVVEIDVHHPSDDKFEIYAEFGVAEFWQYNGEKLKIFKLQESHEYKEIERSEELPILTSEVLTEFLKRGQNEQQFVVLSDFQDWLKGELDK
ncbi:MAG TPA: Uma2 family endonuclease [Pyrinomonadaceae bacterium]|nr:Uma2 family endonuclease [Pyrinomonadaceae bacterium]